MVTLDSPLRVMEDVLFTTVAEDAILLNPRTNQYFALEDVGARLWSLLSAGQSLHDAYDVLCAEYDVDAAQLETDLLELAGQLLENGLVELAG